MGVLNDREILAAIHNGEFSISPLQPNNIQPASIDLTLHHTLEVLQVTSKLDVADSVQSLKSALREISVTDTGYELQPGHFVTGYSAEEFLIPSFMCAKILNRNSLARCGLDAETAGYINPGFCGRMVIVIRNFAQYPIVLHTGMRICQLQLTRLDDIALRSYGERHNADKILAYAKEALGKLPLSDKASTNRLDSSLSDFLHERIAAAGGGKHVS